jgi:hypothetical protein
MAAPASFHKYLEADVFPLLWEREPSFDVEETGTDTTAYKWLKKHTAPIIPKGGCSLGIGLLDWASHVKAMQARWLLKYLDASDSTWKKILDCWFARTSLKRAAVLSSIPIKTLIQSLKGNIALPTFWRQALAALRELPLTLTNLSTDGALSQPIWDTLHFSPRRISQLHRDRWESLQVTVLHNLYSDREGKVSFTQEDNEKYIDTENNYHYFQNQK